MNAPLSFVPRRNVWLLTLLAAGLGACASITPAQQTELRQQRISDATVRRIRHRRPLTQDQVVELARKGVANSSIIYLLYVTGSHFELTPRQRAQLRARGVRSDVIVFMVENQPPSFLANLF